MSCYSQLASLREKRKALQKEEEEKKKRQFQPLFSLLRRPLFSRQWNRHNWRAAAAAAGLEAAGAAVAAVATLEHGFARKERKKGKKEASKCTQAKKEEDDWGLNSNVSYVLVISAWDVYYLAFSRSLWHATLYECLLG